MKFILHFLIIATVSSFAQAHNKVVVVPLLEDVQSNEQLSNVITVAKSGGDYEDLQDALNAIQDSSTSNRYSVQIAPGTYEIDNTLLVKPGVSVVGSGAGTTTIKAHITSNFSATYDGYPVKGAAIYAVEGNSFANIEISVSGDSSNNIVAVVAGTGESSEIDFNGVDIYAQPGVTSAIRSRTFKLVLNNSRVRMYSNIASGKVIEASDVILASITVQNSSLVLGNHFAANNGVGIYLNFESDLEFTNSEFIVDSSTVYPNLVALHLRLGSSATVRNGMLRGKVRLDNSSTSHGLPSFKSLNSTIVFGVEGEGNRLCLNSNNESEVLPDNCNLPI